MTLTPEELRALREKAERATPGEWKAVESHRRHSRFWRIEYLVTEEMDEMNAGAMFTIANVEGTNDDEDKPNAQFIAAANPTVVLKLLNEIERLRTDLELHQRNYFEAHNKHAADRTELRILRARVAELEAARGGT